MRRRDIPKGERRPLRDVNEPVNMLTTTSARLEPTLSCIRASLYPGEGSPSPSAPYLVLFPLAFPFLLGWRSAPSSSDEMIIMVRNRRAAHFRACGSRRIIFHPLK